MPHIRFAAAACQTDLANPLDRCQMRANTDRMLAMVDAAVAGSAPFLPVRLVVFPEFAHAAPVFPTVEELRRRLAVPIPNEHTERLTAKAREHDLYIQSGSMLEEHERWPGVVFNTTCLIGPGGILSTFRKVNTWVPYEVHASPHDLPDFDLPLFPVAETPLGRIGCAICYDWLFPEALRQLTANGAEILVRVSAYMDPWGATEPMAWWTVVNRTRALENVAYVVAANQGASLRHYPPYSWPGGSQVVDFDGRILAEASPGPGERIVVAPIDVSALRHERATRVGHHMPAHLRTEAYPVYRTAGYPPRERPTLRCRTRRTAAGFRPPRTTSSGAEARPRRRRRDRPRARAPAATRMPAAEGGGGEPAADAPAATARVWVSDGPRYRFPERDPGLPRLPATGICFSGGGTRSLAATAGQLRGLTETGLIADVGHLACVSGAAWAAVPYAYHAGGARDDAELLGPVLPPEKVSLRALETLPETRLDHPATAGFERHLTAAIADADLPRDRVWTRAVGATYLAPFGLFDPRAPAWFTSDAAAAAAVKAANPHLAGTPFHAVHGGAWRPHLVINACLVWPRLPAGATGERQCVGFECTPFGVGAPCRSTLRTASGASCTVGGGYLEPFAFGCPAPASGPDASGRVRVVPLPRPFTLADATAATSASAARAAALPFVPRTHHWPLGVDDGQPGRVHSFADGGDIENFGLIALLRRRVERIVVFVNTLHPLGEEVRPEAERGPVGIDPYIPPLFGYATPKCPHNQVFARAAFGRVAAALRAARRRGRGVVAATRLAVQPNAWWGVAGGWEVEVCWVYNERAPAWEARLDAEIRRAIEEGQPPDATGPFARFPFYRTEGQNPGCLVRLTAPQVNLLADLSCWVVVEHAALLREVLG